MGVMNSFVSNFTCVRDFHSKIPDSKIRKQANYLESGWQSMQLPVTGSCK